MLEKQTKAASRKWVCRFKKEYLDFIYRLHLEMLKRKHDFMKINS